MSFFKSIGHALSQVAPFAGMIPGVGTVAAPILGGLGGLAETGRISGTLKGAARGAIGGLGGKIGTSLLGKIPGMPPIGDMGQNFLSKLGGAVKDSYAPGGKLDLAKIIGTVSAGSEMIGNNRARHSAERYNNAEIDQRNKLMSMILQPSNAGFPQ